MTAKERIAQLEAENAELREKNGKLVDALMQAVMNQPQAPVVIQPTPAPSPQPWIQPQPWITPWYPTICQASQSAMTADGCMAWN